MVSLFCWYNFIPGWLRLLKKDVMPSSSKHGGWASALNPSTELRVTAPYRTLLFLEVYFAFS